MNKIRRTLGILLIFFAWCAGASAQTAANAANAVNAAGAATARDWKTFTPETGAWSILAPGEMRHDSEALETLGRKGGYAFTDKDGFFAVVYEDSAGWKVALSKPFLGSHYKKVRNGFVKNSKGQLLKDVKFKNKGESGREFYVKIPDGNSLNSEGQTVTRHRIGRFRIFFHGKRCYMLIAVLPEAEIDAFAIDNYFNSFVAK